MKHGGRRKGAGRKPGKVPGLPNPVRYSTVLDSVNVWMIRDTAESLCLSEAESVRALISRGYLTIKT